MSQTQTTTTDEQVEPNARYDAVFGTNYALDSETGTPDRRAELEQERLLQSTHREREVLGRKWSEANYSDRETREDPLSWDDLSVTDDSQLLASICSFFTGVSSGEPVEEIRRKLRTADVEHYANVYLVVSGILDPDGDADEEEGEDHV